MYRRKIKTFTVAAVIAMTLTVGLWAYLTYYWEGTVNWGQVFTRGLCVLIICVPLPLKLAVLAVSSEGQRLCEEQGIRIKSALSFEKLGKADIIVFARTEVITGDMDEEIREDDIEAIVMIGMIVQETILITEEDRSVAETLSKHGGVSTVYSNLSSEEKLEIVNQLVDDGKSVMVVGDGRDHEIMRKADGAIAIIEPQEDIEIADVTICESDLLKVEKAILLGRMVLKNIRLSLTWILIYDIIWGLAAAGALYPKFGISVSIWTAILSVVFNTAIVIVNSLMLRKKCYKVAI